MISSFRSAYILITISLFLFSCTKNSLNSKSNSLSGGVSSDQAYSGFIPLTAVAGSPGYYGEGTLEFRLPTTTLPYVTGEEVTSYTAIAAPGSSLLDFTFTGNGGFVAYSASLGGVDVNQLANAVEAYDTAWSGTESRAAAAGTQDTTMKNYPAFNSYLTLLPFYGSEIKFAGFVVRDANSPSTYSVAPSTFKPVIIPAPTVAFIGEIYVAPYTLNFFGYVSTGLITKVTVGDNPNTSPSAYSFSLTGTPVSSVADTEVGTVHVTSTVVVSVNGLVSGY